MSLTFFNSLQVILKLEGNLENDQNTVPKYYLSCALVSYETSQPEVWWP